MKVLVDLCVIPIGTDVSISRYILKCQEVLQAAQLTSTPHAYGTLVEGDWDPVFDAIRQCHEAVHQMGAPRITTMIKVGTREDHDHS